MVFFLSQRPDQLRPAFLSLREDTKECQLSPLMLPLQTATGPQMLQQAPSCRALPAAQASELQSSQMTVVSRC